MRNGCHHARPDALADGVRAMNRQMLLLKDMRMPRLPSDMTGKLYRQFNTYEIIPTVHEQISQWAERDLGLKLL